MVLEGFTPLGLSVYIERFNRSGRSMIHHKLASARDGVGVKNS